MIGKYSYGFIGFAISIVIFVRFTLEIILGISGIVPSTIFMLLGALIVGLISLFYPKIIEIRIIAFLLLFFLGATVLFFVSYSSKDETKLNGKWETDSDEDLTLRLELDKSGLAEMSTSPDFQKAKYLYKIKGQEIYIYQEDRSSSWYGVIQDDMSIVFIDGEDSLVFNKQP